MNTKHHTPRTANRKAVTLVEILVVIVILSVLTALIIPRVRTVNKDRNIRETARVVGAMFSNAAQRAAAEGKKTGVVIARNTNFVDSNYQDSNNNAISFAGTRLFLMRPVPDFAGDDNNSAVWESPDSTSSAYKCRIARPLDHDESANKYLVRPNDIIYLKNQSFGYRIKDVEEIEEPIASGNFVLDLELETYRPSGISRSTFPRPTLPDVSFDLDGDGIVGLDENGQPFRIQRRPRVVESSVVDLPAGYQVDLRYSGWFDDTNDEVQFMLVDDINENNDIVVVFNEHGGLDSVQFDADSAVNPTSSLYLFVSEYDLQLAAMQDPLVRDSNLWVTVNHLNGGTSIGYNNSPGEFVDNTDPVEMRNRITAARDLATNRQDAAQ